MQEPPRSEPIPFERGARARAAASVQYETGGGDSVRPTIDLAAAAADANAEMLMSAVVEARRIVNHLDPVGWGAGSARVPADPDWCAEGRGGACAAPADEGVRRRRLRMARDAAGCFYDRLSHRQQLPRLAAEEGMRELTRSCGRTAEEVQAAVEFIRTLDPRPGAALQRDGDAADRAGCGVCEAR